MNIKYDFQLTDAGFNNYLDVLVDMVYKHLPIFEKSPETLHEYHNSFMHDLIGAEELVCLHENGYFIRLLTALEGLIQIEEKAPFRSKVFECISIVKKLKR